MTFDSRRTSTWVLLAACCLAVGVCSAQASEPVLVQPAQVVQRQPEDVLVKGRTPPGTSPADPLAALGWRRQSPSSGASVFSAAAALRRDPGVLQVQPNYWRHALAVEVTPNDPYYRPDHNQRQYQQWYLPKINANYAWSLAKGRDDLVIAVVDSGVDLKHPELKDRLVQGISLVNQSGYTPPANGQDDNGHGTHVAGLIAAGADNALGLAGCAWFGKIMPVKVLNNKGEGTDADIAAGIRWAVDMGARIINLSLGGPAAGQDYPQAVQDAVDDAYGRGCLIVAASGNSGQEELFYPAGLNHVVSVAATDPWDQRASYSTSSSTVDMAAPGGAGGTLFSKDTGMLSTFWSENSRISDFVGGSEAGEYAVTAGTSMAAAMVSGAAAVVWGHQPGWSADQVENALAATAVDLGPAGPDEQTGAGRIDLLAALGNPPVERPVMTAYNYPNPFRPGQDDATRIVFLLDRPRDVDLRIYDAGRELVFHRSLAAAATLAGKNVILWEGRNGWGEPVANGIYYFQMTSPGGPSSPVKAMAVLR
ncbi:MAG: S8 family serine peptidase [candidate division FCPU426 bacterium]